MRKLYVQVNTLTVVFILSRAGCYYHLTFLCWLLIYEQFELTLINNDKGLNSIAALVQSIPPVDWTSLQYNAAQSNISQ